MNKEVINKYWDAFLYWKDGGRCLAGFTELESHKTEGWFEVSGNTWSHNISTSFTIIQDDEYVELRKALAEGKVIQLNDGLDYKGLEQWNTAYPDKTPFETYPMKLYRIKPDESKFKVGDFMRHPESMNIITITSTDLVHGIEHLIPWESQPNEWCLFYDNSHVGKEAMLKQFSHKDKDGHYWPKFSKHNCYQNCEPFTSTLPSGYDK